MANLFGASRTKTRDFELRRLTLTSQIKNGDPSRLYWRDWERNGSFSYRQYYQRTKDGIFLFNSKPSNPQSQDGYHILFNEVTLSYGIRYQFTCPKCDKAARILYFKNSRFVCRQCSGVTYESTHSGEFDSLLYMIKNQRKKIFGQEIVDTYRLCYSDPSEWLPKPKYKHLSKHENDLKRIKPIEDKYLSVFRERMGCLENI
jgi:hypothetical protein